MIYAVAATPQGKEAIAKYEEGEQEGIPLLHAFILARTVAAEEGVTSIRDLVSMIGEDYPLTSIAPGGISNAIERLGGMGFVRIIREVNSASHVIVEIGLERPIKVPTTLGLFFNANHTTERMREQVTQELQRSGVYTVEVAGIRIRLQ